jgi:hypothetical protein
MIDDITSLSSVSCVANNRCGAYRCSNVYLTMNINAFLKINTQKYIFLNQHI